MRKFAKFCNSRIRKASKLAYIIPSVVWRGTGIGAAGMSSRDGEKSRDTSAVMFSNGFFPLARNVQDVSKVGVDPAEN